MLLSDCTSEIIQIRKEKWIAKGREEAKADLIIRATKRLMEQRPELSEEEARKIAEDLLL